MATKKNGWTHTDYLSEVFNPRKLKATIAWCVRAILLLQRRGVKFDTLAFTGTSGAAVGFAVAAILGIPLTFVRKPTSGVSAAHFDGELEGRLDTKTFIFIDDFVSSGATFKRVQKKMGRSKCVGVVLYAGTNKSYALGGLRREHVVARRKSDF